ncbi:MAG: RluA family pseudouridine synthase [bacterium]|nr:RluA family pseudouridine synthase [bacterium]
MTHHTLEFKESKEPKVIFEDESLLVLNKPAGITVNKSDTTKGEKTVQDWVDSHYVILNGVKDPGSNDLPAGKAGMLNQVQHDNGEERSGFTSRSGIVHRLDKETSGILLVAKNQEAFENLQQQFKERRVKKVYTALVHGKVVPGDGEIRVPVGRLPWNRKRFGVVAGGREAVTKYHVLSIMYHVLDKKKEQLSILELYPETGRTHQIRVHLKHIGHPIFSDSLYAGRKTARDDRKVLSRMFLHASKISFQHPKTEKNISFESSLPGDLDSFLKILQS